MVSRKGKEAPARAHVSRKGSSKEVAYLTENQRYCPKGEVHEAPCKADPETEDGHDSLGEEQVCVRRNEGVSGEKRVGTERGAAQPNARALKASGVTHRWDG